VNAVLGELIVARGDQAVSRQRLIGRNAIFLPAILAIALASTGEDRASRVEKWCSDAAACIPEWTSPLIVYVRAAGGAAIAGARLEMVPRQSETAPTGTPRGGWTDGDGMAAVSREPSVPYSLTVTAPGFKELSTTALGAEGARAEVVLITLALDRKPSE
jgi:hypothetical protein